MNQEYFGDCPNEKDFELIEKNFRTAIDIFRRYSSERNQIFNGGYFIREN
jgi:hypothetical protein